MSIKKNYTLVFFFRFLGVNKNYLQEILYYIFQALVIKCYHFNNFSEFVKN